MAFVTDASITLCWAFPDEESETAQFAFVRASSTREPIHAPVIWWSEVSNALIINEKRGRISTSDADRFLRELDHLKILIDRAANHSDIMTLARRHG
jgi:predicted nucleic acid-binding protein